MRKDTETRMKGKKVLKRGKRVYRGVKGGDAWPWSRFYSVEKIWLCKAGSDRSAAAPTAVRQSPGGCAAVGRGLPCVSNVAEVSVMLVEAKYKIIPSDSLNVSFYHLKMQEVKPVSLQHS